MVPTQVLLSSVLKFLSQGQRSLHGKSLPELSVSGPWFSTGMTNAPPCLPSAWLRRSCSQPSSEVGSLGGLWAGDPSPIPRCRMATFQGGLAPTYEGRERWAIETAELVMGNLPGLVSKTYKIELYQLPNEQRRRESYASGPRGLVGPPCALPRESRLTLRDTVAPARSLSWGSVGRLLQIM